MQVHTLPPRISKKNAKHSVMLAALKRLEINGQVEVKWRTLCTIEHSIMVHARVLEAYIHFAFIYTTDHIFPVLPIKDLINKYVKTTMPFKLATGMKPSISHSRVLFFRCVVHKSTAHVGKRC